MRKAKIYSAQIKGTFTQIKAYNKKHALEGFKRFDESVTLKDIAILDVVNSHQVVWDEF